VESDQSVEAISAAMRPPAVVKADDAGELGMLSVARLLALTPMASVDLSGPAGTSWKRKCG
jgi:hypothetical protein